MELRENIVIVIIANANMASVKRVTREAVDTSNVHRSLLLNV